MSDIAWWIHNLVVLSFLNLLPLSKHFHVVTSIPNVFFTKLEPYGRLSKQDLENAEIYVRRSKQYREQLRPQER